MTIPNAGLRIAQVREHMKWSRRTVAADAGISHQYLGEIERGEAENVGAEVLDKVARALRWPSFEALMASTALEPNPFESIAGTIAVKRELRSSFEELPVYDGWGAAQVLSGVENQPDPKESRFPPEGYEDEIGPNGMAVIVRGESMAGWQRRPIFDGDRCWVNPHVPFRGRGVVAVVVRESEDSEPKCVIKFHDGDGRLYSVPASGIREPLEVFEILGMAKVIVVDSPPGEP